MKVGVIVVFGGIDQIDEKRRVALIVTGMSGAGKQSVMRVLEDLGKLRL